MRALYPRGDFMNTVWNILCAFLDGFMNRQKLQSAKDKALRKHLSERQVDQMLKDTFPASDPPSTY